MVEEKEGWKVCVYKGGVQFFYRSASQIDSQVVL